jgi:hypothetical protein
MYAKTLELFLLATVALLCALAAWIMDHAVFGSVFFGVLCSRNAWRCRETLALT